MGVNRAGLAGLIGWLISLLLGFLYSYSTAEEEDDKGTLGLLFCLVLFEMGLLKGFIRLLGILGLSLLSSLLSSDEGKSNASSGLLGLLRARLPWLTWAQG